MQEATKTRQWRKADESKLDPKPERVPVEERLSRNQADLFADGPNTASFVLKGNQDRQPLISELVISLYFDGNFRVPRGGGGRY